MSFRGIFDPSLPANTPLSGMFDPNIFDTENKNVTERNVITAFIHGTDKLTTAIHGNRVITVK